MAQQERDIRAEVAQLGQKVVSRRTLLRTFAGGGLATALLAACGVENSGPVNVRGKVAGVDIDFDVTPKTPVAGSTSEITTQRAAATEAPRATATARVESLPSFNVKFAPPTDFRPEVRGGVQNVLLEQAPKGVWFHPMTEVRFMNNQQIVWSYDYYYLDGSQRLDLVQHGGEEGRMIFRQNHDETARLVLGVGRMTSFTDSAGKQHDLRSNVQGGPAMINIRTHPNVLIRAFNPDTGERLIMNGQPVELTTSESGDAGFVLGNSGRVLFVADLPKDTGLETMVWEGPHDRPNLKLNIIDITSVIAVPSKFVAQPTVRPTVAPTAECTQGCK